MASSKACASASRSPLEHSAVIRSYIAVSSSLTFVVTVTSSHAPQNFLPGAGELVWRSPHIAQPCAATSVTWLFGDDIDTLASLCATCSRQPLCEEFAYLSADPHRQRACASLDRAVFRGLRADAFHQCLVLKRACKLIGL